MTRAESQASLAISLLLAFLVTLALLCLAACGGSAHVTSQGTRALLVNCDPVFDSYDPDSYLAKLQDSCLEDADHRYAQNVALDLDSLYSVCSEFVEQHQQITGCEPPINFGFAAVVVSCSLTDGHCETEDAGAWRTP